MYLISVIIPCYNAEDHLSSAILSVYNQNLNTADFELIVINDGSTDATEKLVSELIHDKPNVRIISQKNKGLGGARNTGIVHAAGKYLLFLDADDYLAPNVLSSLITLALEKKMDIVEFAAAGVDESGKILFSVSNKSDVFSSGYAYYKNVRYLHSACNKLYKREFLIHNKLYFQEKIYIEDFEFNTRCLITARRILATDSRGVFFLQSQNSITRNVDHAKRLKMSEDIRKVIESTAALYYTCSGSKESQTFFLERLNFLVATLFFRLVNNKASLRELKKVRNQLSAKNLYFVDHKIYDFKKNVFRIILLKHLWLYRYLKYLFPLLRKFTK